MRRITITTVALCALLLPVVVQAELPEHTVRRTAGTILIDGILDEKDWEAAESFGDFKFPWWKEGEKEQTVAKMLWDDNFLYLSFSCEDKHIWADHYDSNTATCLDDCAEIFWDPNPETLGIYYMFEMSCIGNSLNLYNNREKDYKKIIVPHIAQTIKGTVNDDSDEDTRWVLEVAIRFSDYPDISNGKTPKDGDMWRIGLHRCGGKTNEQFSQWSPSKTPSPNYHRPQDFGNVFFSKKAVIIEK